MTDARCQRDFDDAERGFRNAIAAATLALVRAEAGAYDFDRDPNHCAATLETAARQLRTTGGRLHAAAETAGNSKLAARTRAQLADAAEARKQFQKARQRLKEVKPGAPVADWPGQSDESSQSSHYTGPTADEIVRHLRDLADALAPEPPRRAWRPLRPWQRLEQRLRAVWARR